MGVLGGTFDPLHVGHLRAAEAVLDALSLDRVLFVPTASPPHKEGHDISSVEHRVAMVELSVAAEGSFALSRVEVDRGGHSYTIDTLTQLRRESPRARFTFIVGSDAFAEIETWKDWRRLLSGFSFAVHERPGFGLERIQASLRGVGRVDDEAEGGFGLDEPAVVFIRRPMLDVSSTEIREAVRRRHSIRFLVPDAVAGYIRENRLYERG
ncbi:MAG TPA: nicotinate-nucleotide adenylyltransferase [Vicinamibacteria bacterium]|nr:nicotinate-nucleotide adenylyltransferase [Vicinamibacteria bacterium]